MLSKGVLLLAVLTVGALTDAAVWDFVNEDEMQSDQSDENEDEMQSDESVAVTRTQCALTCPVSASSSKFGYTPGKTYEYLYETDVKTSVPGTAAEHSSLHVRATVQIEVVTTCDMVLRISDVSLQDSSPNNFESRQHVESAVAFRRGLQSKTMSFAFVDGRIDSICPDAEDEKWAVNIKRGILSTLQNTMTTLQGITNGREIDVAGDCPVRYEQVTGGWGTRKVKKTKNLIGCSDRHYGQTVFQAIEYDVASDIQSMPLIKSTHSCEQEISNGDRIITKSICSETHVFRPFAKGNSGATTEVTYKLEFQRHTDGISAQPAISQVRRTLLFDNTLTDVEMADTVREARTTLSALCRQTETDVRPDAAALFGTLVKQMRKLDANNLKRFLTAAKSGTCQKAEKYFRDALPVLGTTGSVVVMRDIMTQGQANDAEIDRWLSAIAFISNPTPDMMKELKPLLTYDFERSSLPVSSLINTYCQIYDEQDDSEVQQMIKLFEDELRYNCKYETDAQRSRIVKALKAIGNAGNAENFVQTLNRCVANKDIPVAVRVAAITAFRRTSCSASRDELMSLMENKMADSELRIMSYLAVMQCPTTDVISRVQKMLQSEEVNQVGSFIWTHLTNLQETSCPMKYAIQDLLKDVELTKAFDLDKRKFSRNVELSGFSEVFNVGALVDSNVIFSSESYIPRSASVNLTLDVFGQSVNLIELGGRAQGLEGLVERFFRPGSEGDNSIRQKRAVIRDDIINQLDRKFPKSRDDLALSYYMRVFGNEIRSGEIFDFDFEGIKNRYNYLNWMIQLAQDNRIDFTKNFMFLDSNLVIPTGVGLPLRLGVEGTATVAITASGKVDIRQMFTMPSTFDINGSIRPSAAVEIRGEMGVDARFATTGLKTVNTMHTSTILDGKIQLVDGKLFNLDLNVPQEKVEIFSAESHVFIVYRGQDREQQSLIPGAFQKTQCTSPQVTGILGMELCGEVSLTGPFVAKAYLNKRDTYTGFHFEAGYRQSPVEMSDSVRISFNTPGSRIDREMTLDFKLDRINSQVDVNLKSPWKKVNAQGSLVSSAALKRATIKAVLDDVREYSFTAELQTEDKRTEMRYTPTIRVNYPDVRGQATEVIFDGSVVHTKEKKLTVNLSLRNAFQQPVTFNATITRQDKKMTVKYDTVVQFSSYLVKGGLTGFVSNIRESGSTWSSRAEVSYQVTGDKNKEKIIINHKFRDLSTSNLRSYSTDMSWTSSMRPHYNGLVGLELAFSPNSLRTKIEVGLDNVKKITIVQSGAYDFTGTDKKVNGMLKFELPYRNWDYELKLDHIHNLNILQSNATVKYAENKQVSLDVGTKKEDARFLNVEAEAILRTPTREMSYNERLTERAPREYYDEIRLRGFPLFNEARITTVYKMLARHEFSTEIDAGAFERLSIKGHLNPNLRNFESRAEIAYGPKNYMADVNWVHRGTTTDAFNTRASAELGYLGRAYGLTTEVSRRSQEFSTSAELKIAGNTKYALSSQVTASRTEPKVQVRFEWPENFAAVSVLGKYETRGWLTTTSDLEGSVQFTSSIRRFEQIGASFRHDYATRSIKTVGEVSWAADKKIAGDLSYDKTKIVVEVTTPFAGYQVLKFEGGLVPKTKMYSHGISSKLSWDSNQMTLFAASDLQNFPSLNGKIMFTSPFSGYESLSANLRHNVAGEKYQTSADVSWTRNQQIAVAVNMNHNRNGWTMTNSGDLTVQTPFRGWRVTKLTWSHQNDDSVWKCHQELELDRQRYVFDVDGSHRLTRVMRRVTASVSFQSPIRGMENIKFETEYQHDLRGIKSSGKSTFTMGSDTFTHEHDVNIVPNSAVVVKAQVTTPIRNLGQIGVNMNNRRNGNTYTAANELILDRFGKSTLGGSLTLEGYSVDANLRFTTPYERLERLTAALKNVKQDDVWVTHADIEYAPDKTYSVDTKLGWESQKKVELEIRTPHHQLRSAKFNAGLTGTPRNFQLSSELEHNAYPSKVQFVARVNTLNAINANGLIEIRTPFSSFSNFKVTARHARQSSQRCVTTASYELNEYRGSLNHEANLRSWADFNTKTELEYLNGRKLELTSSFAVDPKITASANFKSSSLSVREAGVAFESEGPLDNFKSSLEVSYNRQSKINTNVEFTYRQGSLRGMARLTTPYRPVERVALECNYNGSPSNFRSDASFELNNKRFATAADFSLSGTNLNFNGELTTPIDHLRQITASLTHNGNWRSFSNSAKISYDGPTISATSEFNANGPTGKFTLSTPYEQVKNLAVSFNRSGKQLKAKAMINVPEEYSIAFQQKGDTARDFSNTATVKLDDRTITGTTSFKYTSASLIEGKATVESTYPGVDKIEATFKHEGPIGDFTTKASLTTPFRRHRSYSTELTYRGNPSDFSSSLSVTTPYSGYENFAISTTFRGDRTNFRSSATITTSVSDYERLNGELSYSGPWNSLQLNGKFEGSSYPTYSIKIENSVPATWQINSAVEVTGPSGRFTTALTANGEANNFKTGLKVTTPHSRYENFELSIEKNGSPSNVELSAELKTSMSNWERTAVSWSHNLDDVKSIRLNGQVETSVYGWEKISASLNHNGIPETFQTTLTLETPKQGYERQTITINHNSKRNIKTSVALETSLRRYPRFGASFEFATARKVTKSSVSVETPIPGYERFSGSMEHNAADANGFRSTFQASTPIRGYERFGATFSHRGDGSQFETSVSLTTPFRGLPQIDVTVRHRGQLLDFTTGASVEYGSKKIETEVAFKRTASRYDSSYEGSIKFSSPCPYVRDFNLAATHSRQQEAKTGSLDVTLNGQKKVDLDYRYTTSGDQQISINIRDPYQMSTQLNMVGTDGQAVVNWDTSRPDGEVRFDFGLMNTQTSELTDRSIRLKTLLPRRTIGFDLGYTVSADKFTHRGDFQWDSDAESEVKYEIEASRSATRYVTTYDGKVKITSGLVTTISSFTHKSNPRGKYSTELVLESSERLRIFNDLAMTSTGFTNTLLVQHPRFSQDASVTTEGSFSDNSNSIKTTVNYERQSFIVEGQMGDNSQYGSLKKSGFFRVAHPNSFTDVKLSGDVSNDYEKAAGNVELQYQMSRDRSMQTSSVRTEVNKLRNEFTIELKSPVETLLLTGTNRYPDDSNAMCGYEITVQTSQCYKKASYELSVRDRSFDVKLYRTATDYLHIFGQALTPIQANVEISHYTNGERTNDVSASISLSDDRLLTGRAFIRPNLRRDAEDYLRTQSFNPTELSSRLQQSARSLSDDFDLKSRRLQQAVTPLAGAANFVADSVSAKLDELNSVFNDMYRRNEFYLRDIHLALQNVVDQITRELARSFEAVSYRVQRYVEYYSAQIQQRMDSISRCLADSWERTARRIQELQPYWDNAFEIISRKIEELRSHPRFRAMVQRLSSLQLSDFLPPADWQQRLASIYATYKARIEGALSGPELREVREWLIRKVEENKWVYEYLGYKEQVALWIEQARALTWESVKVKAIGQVREFLQLHKNRWTTWDVSRGEYAFQLYVPVDLPDLSFLQRFNLRKYIDFLTNLIAKLIPDEEWTILDTVYAYRPSGDVRNWIPPFKSHASISGSQHFVTFDHNAYEFAGECSYLLTRDFVDKSFSVVVNYDKVNSNNQPTRKSITVMADGKQVEVFADAKITVDGVRVEMPTRVANTTVMRTGNSIRVDNDRGFSVVCDLPHDHCSVSVSGWYYNKLAGLLGTNDNEPANDMTTIDNTISDQPETFAYGWTVGQRCRPNNRAVRQTFDEDRQSYKVCARYFKESSSPFRSCFRQVDPTPFLAMCVNDMPASDLVQSEEGVCKVAAAYMHECRNHEVILRLPSVCVRCELPDSSRTYFEKSTFAFNAEQPAPKIADVVFIVQHAACNKDVLDKVKGLVDDLDKAMTSEGMTSTRYAIVGFGGKGHLAAPHTHTMDGQIFNSVSKINQGLNKFDLEAGEFKDPLDAIRYSTTKLAFRAGASKTFVLLACSECSEQSIRYRDIQRALLESDVRLHVLIKDIIRPKSHSAKTAYIFGADLDTVYTRTDVASEDLTGEPHLRRYIYVPKDLCVALTQDTAGSFFSARQWLDSRPLIQKRFADVMVRTIARKAQPSECQYCECFADEIGVGVSRCGSCEIRSPVGTDNPLFVNDTIEVAPKVISPPDNKSEAPKETATQAPAMKPIRTTTPRRRPTTRAKSPRVRPTPKPRQPRPAPRQ